MNKENINNIRRDWKQIKLFDLLIHILASILLVLLVVIIGILIAKKLNKKYVYVDMYESTGKSYECYYNESSRDLRCMIPVKVQQYSREK